MKKILSYVLLILIITSLSFTAFADFENPSIVDDAGYLMQSELADLSGKLDKVRNEYDFEVAIYTESELSSDTAEASADDIYDYIAPYLDELSADAYIEKVTPTARQIYQYEYSRSDSVRFTYATASTSALSCHTLECKDNNSVWVANNITSGGYAVENYSSENLSSATTIYLWF